MRRMMLASLCLLAIGCSKKADEEQPAGTPASTSETPAAGSPAGDTKAASGAGAAGKGASAPGGENDTKPDAEAIAEGEVQRLLDAWLDAQNRGDFAAYEALYAKRFTGIKRAGARMRQYDRDGWLADRGRMFRRKMTVTAADPQIAAGVRTVVVTFTQAWASGAFQDEGPKQLVIVREGDALRIAREEMLRSTVLAPEAEAAALAREDFAFVTQKGDAVHIVLETDAQDAWATGKPVLVSAGDAGAAAVRAADRAALPAALSAWQGKRVALYTAAGAACTGTVESLGVMTGFEPHFGTEQEWQDSNASNERMAREIWDMGEGVLHLVGRVAAGCEGPFLWARASDRPAVVPLTRAPAGDGGDGIRAAVIARFRTLAGHRAIQKEYTAETGKTSPWDEYEGESPSVVVFRDPASGRGVAAVNVVAGIPCEGFYGEFWAAFEIVPRAGKSDLVLLTHESDPGDRFVPDTVIDADGDGSFELVGMGALLRKVGAVHQETESMRFPDHSCPC